MFLGLGGPGSPFTTLNASSQFCCRHGLACVLAPRLLTAVVLLMLLVLLLVDARTYMCDTQTRTAAPSPIFENDRGSDSDSGELLTFSS